MSKHRKTRVKIAGTYQDKRTHRRPEGKGAVMNVVITDYENVPDKNNPTGHKQMVAWTCPKKLSTGKPCLKRNLQRFYGRADHCCIECEQWTNIKGESQPANKAGVLA